MDWRALLAAAADLALGAECACCGRPGPVACDTCRSRLCGTPPFPLAQDASVWAAGEYNDDLRRAILACKERQGLGVVPLLVELGARSAAALVRARWRAGPVVLTPVPGDRHRTAARGFDLPWLLARGAARRLAATGLDARAKRTLRQARVARDQVGLGIRERAANRRASMTCHATAAGVVLVVDDIVTTGSTLTEARRALAAAGQPVLGCAVVAATPRHSG